MTLGHLWAGNLGAPLFSEKGADYIQAQIPIQLVVFPLPLPGRETVTYHVSPRSLGPSSFPRAGQLASDNSCKELTDQIQTVWHQEAYAFP